MIPVYRLELLPDKAPPKLPWESALLHVVPVPDAEGAWVRAADARAISQALQALAVSMPDGLCWCCLETRLRAHGHEDGCLQARAAWQGTQ